ncbi:carboxymuconolactone decarboxylase family protein [Micromonospora sp. WMMD1082]|uniref:carboxymuconolactone decarboxylase family protein n=1 Tax=Micromonospora sp. WMMD1082 TaxID=3016104 RepID=UPI0024175441|nr:carboxymuconolactone decarboxylase family protein [Micromonospora sp. WMMD1082]MDG4793444.1 carboxymuconolactone decarboxylase family protein [Micromonospora sp. WMMD1082]
MSSLFSRSARRASLSHIRRIAPVPPGSATGVVVRVYGQMEAEFGMLAPPVALHAAAPETLAAVWMMLRETLLAGDPADRAAKEAVAAAVSRANACPYCVEVHGAAFAGVGGDGLSSGVVTGHVDQIDDPWLRELTMWAAASGHRAAGARRRAPFEVDRAPSFIGVAMMFHYINRMVTVYLGESPLLPIPRGGHALARRMAVRIFGHFARVGLPAGLATELLPAAPAPEDLAWAATGSAMADALARGFHAVDRAGTAAIPSQVRAVVATGLDDPDATPPGLLIDDWLAGHLTGVAPADRPLARLALLTAWAPHRVTDTDLADLRAAGLDDAALIRVTAWSSLAAARRIAVRLFDDLHR